MHLRGDSGGDVKEVIGWFLVKPYCTGLHMDIAELEKKKEVRGKSEERRKEYSGLFKYSP